jgi:hypothetical protein
LFTIWKNNESGTPGLFDPYISEITFLIARRDDPSAVNGINKLSVADKPIVV